MSIDWTAAYKLANLLRTKTKVGKHRNITLPPALLIPLLVTPMEGYSSVWRDFVAAVSWPPPPSHLTPTNIHIK